MRFPWVFAGDIARGADSVRWMLDQRALLGRPVLFVAGNHEYYRGVLEDVAAEIRDAARGTNVTFLDADVVPVIDGVRFVGCTMWTDYMFGGNQYGGMREGLRLNDHRMIETSYGRKIPRSFSPNMAFDRHWRERQWLLDRLAEDHDGQTVVVTHHAAHPGSLHPKYANAGHLNASFISDLRADIDEFQPAVWIHGHVHDSHDYIADGGTRIVCNPRGYSLGAGRSENAGFDPALVIEIPEWVPRPRWGI
jgi:hypothetical protein